MKGSKKHRFLKMLLWYLGFCNIYDWLCIHEPDSLGRLGSGSVFHGPVSLVLKNHNLSISSNLDIHNLQTKYDVTVTYLLHIIRCTLLLELLLRLLIMLLILLGLIILLLLVLLLWCSIISLLIVVTIHSAALAVAWLELRS